MLLQSTPSSFSKSEHFSYLEKDDKSLSRFLILQTFYLSWEERELLVLNRNLSTLQQSFCKTLSLNTRLEMTWLARPARERFHHLFITFHLSGSKTLTLHISTNYHFPSIVNPG